MQKKKNSIELVLDSINKQTLEKQLIEIIFIDNGSNDNTIDFITKWISLHENVFGQLRLAYNPEPSNRSKSRNIGVEAASGEKLLFIDDDTVLYSETLLDSLISKFYNRNTFFCGARRYWTITDWDFKRVKEALNRNENIESIAFLPKGISRETGRRDLQEFSFIGNFGGLLKKDFIHLGGFDAERFPDRQEDVDFMFRLLLQNYEFQFLDDSFKVIHLTHPIISRKKQKQQYWFKEFRKKELEEGYYFCINHLFKVYEDHLYDHPVLKKI